MAEADRCAIAAAVADQRTRTSLSAGSASLATLEPDRVLVAVSSLRRGLTRRQQQIAEYAAAGATADEIARCLSVSRYTVRQHLKDIYRRLEIGNRVELVHALGL